MELPFAALHQLCVSMLDRLATLPDPQRDAATTAFGLTSGTRPDRLLIGLAVLHLLSAVSDDGPLLCIVDDAHWLDRESAHTLAFVARRLQADPVAIVFATRWPMEDLAGLPELRVGRLHDSDAQSLLYAVLPVPLDERIRDRVVAETQGNPLALIEWPRGLTPADLAGGFGMPTSMAITSRIEESFRRRMDELPSPSRRFLTVAAAEPSGDNAIVWRAATALGIGRHDAVPAVDAGLVELGVRVWFRHPLVRRAAYRSASSTDRRAAHRELADATDPDLDPDRRAWHRALAASAPDEDVAGALERSAGRVRARGGVAAAGALLERSVALTVDPSRRADRMLAAAAAHLEAGSFEVAAGLLAAAEATPLDDVRRARLELLQAVHAVTGGDVRDAPGLFLRAAKRFEPLDVDVARNTYLQAVTSAVYVGSLGRDVGIAEAARAASGFPMSNEPNANEWLLLGLALATVEGPGAAARALRRALETTPRDSFGVEAIHWLGYQCAAATVLWDNDALHELAVRHVTSTREIGALNMLPTALNTLALVCVFEGDLDGAAAAIDEATHIVAVTGSHLVPSVDATRAGLQGEDDAERVVDAQIATARAEGHGLALKSALWARATLLNGTGDYERALVAATEAMAHPWEWVSQLSFHELVEAATRCRRFAVANLALERLAETVAASGSDWAVGIQRRSQALVAPDAVAEGLFGEAIERLRRTSIRPELARAHLLYGEWLRRQNRRVDARAQLRTAWEMLAAMKIERFAERARRELLATGETVRKRTADSIDELTAQESRIARLAADGLRNPEIGSQLFISPRTVEWHLRKVFTKLQVTSRRELREALPRHGPAA
jgi:DNA-binding CsgD family transcriptional regulator/tetratricopeptide (TPR) repeat protein